jgi:hypothetical protein
MIPPAVDDHRLVLLKMVLGAPGVKALDAVNTINLSISLSYSHITEIPSTNNRFNAEAQRRRGAETQREAQRKRSQTRRHKDRKTAHHRNGRNRRSRR